MAYMAMKANDLPTAHKLLEEIGDSWDPKIWGSVNEFESAKSTASQ
jgi:hypothetical protein